jgi:hypothetical protein
MFRDSGDALEMAFADLLAAAGIIEADDFDRYRVVEVRHGRVVETNVAVFADADEAGVDWGFGQQGAVAAAFRLQVRRVTVDVARGRR